MAKSRVHYAIVADFETGGLPSKDKAAFDVIALTEACFVVVDLHELKIVQTADWLVKPYYKEGLEYSIGAQQATGITPKMLEEKGQPLDKVFKEMKEIIKKYSKGIELPIMVGHNWNKFDAPFIENMFSFFGEDFYKLVAGYEDTMIWGGIKFLESENYKLGTICSNLGIELLNAHRAVADTTATAKAFINMVSCLRNSGFESEKPKEETGLRGKFKLDVNYNYGD